MMRMSTSPVPRGRATILSLFSSIALYSIEPIVVAESVQIGINPERQLVWSVAFSPDDRYVFATTQEGVVLISDRESCGLDSVVAPIPISDGPATLTGMAWSPTKPEFAVAMRDGSGCLWAVDGVRINEKAIYFGTPSNKGDHLPGMRSVAFSPDGTLLAAAGHGRAIYVWSTDGALAPLHILKGHGDTISAVVFGRNNAAQISAGLDETIRIWDIDNEREVRAIKTPVPVFNAAVSPNGRYVAASSGYGDNNTAVHDFDTGEEVRRFTIPKQHLPWSRPSLRIVCLRL